MNRVLDKLKSKFKTIKFLKRKDLEEIKEYRSKHISREKSYKECSHKYADGTSAIIGTSTLDYCDLCHEYFN